MFAPELFVITGAEQFKQQLNGVEQTQRMRARQPHAALAQRDAQLRVHLCGLRLQHAHRELAKLRGTFCKREKQTK